MSRLAMEALIDADCSPVEKVVLLVLARHGKGANGSGGYPDVRRIARMAGISTSTTQAALKSMRAKGWLSWTSGNKGKHEANSYTVHLDAVPMLPDLWRSPIHACGGCRHTRVSDRVAATDTPVYRSGPQRVAVADTQASTEAKTKEGEGANANTGKQKTPSPAAGFSSRNTDRQELSFRDQAQHVANAVIEVFGAVSPWARDQLVRTAESELKAIAKTDPVPSEELRNIVRDSMVRQRKRYVAAYEQGMLRALELKTIEKFFAEPEFWKNSKLWGFKNGKTAEGIAV